MENVTGKTILKNETKYQIKYLTSHQQIHKVQTERNIQQGADRPCYFHLSDYGKNPDITDQQ